MIATGIATLSSTTTYFLKRFTSARSHRRPKFLGAASTESHFRNLRARIVYLAS